MAKSDGLMTRKTINFRGDAPTVALDVTAMTATSPKGVLAPGTSTTEVAFNEETEHRLVSMWFVPLLTDLLRAGTVQNIEDFYLQAVPLVFRLFAGNEIIYETPVLAIQGMGVRFDTLGLGAAACVTASGEGRAPCPPLKLKRKAVLRAEVCRDGSTGDADGVFEVFVSTVWEG